MVRDRDLELLLGAAQDEAAASESTDDLAQLVQGCVDHLNCSVGALLIPDKNIAVCRTGQDVPPRVGADVLTARTATCSPGLSCTVRPSTSNPTGRGRSASQGCLTRCCRARSCHGAQRVLGVLVLFKPAQSPDFRPAARCASSNCSRVASPTSC